MGILQTKASSEKTSSTETSTPLDPPSYPHLDSKAPGNDRIPPGREEFQRSFQINRMFENAIEQLKIKDPEVKGKAMNAHRRSSDCHPMTPTHSTTLEYPSNICTFRKDDQDYYSPTP
jgi:hypothetical protein